VHIPYLGVFGGLAPKGPISGRVVSKINIIEVRANSCMDTQPIYILWYKDSNTYFRSVTYCWLSYSNGEKLFGSPITQYPDLEKTKKELELLDKLYSLHTAVVQTISGYSDVLWTDAQANMESMTEQVNGFQANCKKLPKNPP